MDNMPQDTRETLDYNYTEVPPSPVVIDDTRLRLEAMHTALNFASNRPQMGHYEFTSLMDSVYKFLCGTK